MEENNRTKRKENHTTRIAEECKTQFDDIRDKRKRLEYKKISDREITDLIIRHDLWKGIKKDIIHAGEDEIKK